MKLADIQNPSTAYTPIVVCAAVLERITADQAGTVTRLIDTHDHVGFAQLRTDSWMKDAILFDLWTGDPKSGGGDCVLAGLIEADGRCHT